MTEKASDVKAGRFAVVTMADGRRRAFRISQVWEPGEPINYGGRDVGTRSVQMVSLENLCLTWSSSIVSVMETEAEARIFSLERDLEGALAALLREREAHSRSRDKLARIMACVVGTVPG